MAKNAAMGGPAWTGLENDDIRICKAFALMGSSDEVGLCRARDAHERVGRDLEDVPGRSGGRPDPVEVEKARIEEGLRRRQMAHRGDAADGEARPLADQLRVRLLEGLARRSAGLGGVDLVAARGDEQDHLARFRPAEDDGLGDLVDLAACPLGRHGGRGRGSDLDRGRADSGFLERAGHPAKALRHATLPQAASQRACARSRRC